MERHRFKVWIPYRQLAAAPSHWVFRGARPDFVELERNCYGHCYLGGANVWINHLEGTPFMGDVAGGNLLVSDRGGGLYIEWMPPADLTDRLLSAFYRGRLTGVSPGGIRGDTRREWRNGKLVEVVENFVSLEEVSFLLEPSRPLWATQTMEVVR